MKSVSFLGVSFAQVGSQASQRFEFSVPRRARVHQRCLLLPIASECDGSQVVFAQNRSGTDCGIGKFSTHRHHHYRGKKDTGCFCVVLSLVFFLSITLPCADARWVQAAVASLPLFFSSSAFTTPRLDQSHWTVSTSNRCLCATCESK